MKRINFSVGAFGLILFFTLVSFVYAQEQAPGQEKKDGQEDAYTLETVSGEVSGFTKNSISIIYDRDYEAGTEFEMLLPIESGVAVKHKKDLSEIKNGDLVSVEYEKPAEGSKRKVKARTINFIQSGVASLTSETAPAGDAAAQP